MPSSPGYVRNYSQEYKTAVARGEVGTGSKSGNAVRHRARRKAVELGMVKPGDHKDVDHAKALAQGGGNAVSNLRVRTPSQNRSFPRNAAGGMIANHPEKK